jgi:hypothetical protein
MRYSFLLLLWLACLAEPLAGQNEQWHTYRNDGGNFSVLMPVEPTESATPAQEGASASHTIQAISGGAGYTLCMSF